MVVELQYFARIYKQSMDFFFTVSAASAKSGRQQR